MTIIKVKFIRDKYGAYILKFKRMGLWWKFREHTSENWWVLYYSHKKDALKEFRKCHGYKKNEVMFKIYPTIDKYNKNAAHKSSRKHCWP